MSSNVRKQEYTVKRADRRLRNNHNSLLILLTGLSGSGKSTIANKLEEKLHAKELKTFALDGDNMRQGLCQDLNFSEEDRTENLRRIAEVSALMIDAGIITIAAFVSPYIATREMMRNVVGTENFVEVYVNTSLETCEERDVKGLYAKARKGLIKNFTGISAPYEKPENPDVVVNTEHMTSDDAVLEILSVIEEKLILH